MEEGKKKYLIERVMNYLRGKQKRLQKIDVQCTLDELLKNFNEDEKKDYIIFQNVHYKKEFSQYIKNNPKILFDLNKNTFSFKKRFTSPRHFLNVLEEEKIGCLENDDLYDDLNKDDIKKLKSADLIREIYIKEKKTKPAIIILFGKNHIKNIADQTGYEKQTNNFLKKYWNSIEEEALQLEKSDKYSNRKYLNRNQKISKKQNQQRTYQSRLEKNIKNWKNNYLEDKIEKALSKIKNIVEISTKNKFKKFRN